MTELQAAYAAPVRQDQPKAFSWPRPGARAINHENPAKKSPSKQAAAERENTRFTRRGAEAQA